MLYGLFVHIHSKVLEDLVLDGEVVESQMTINKGADEADDIGVEKAGMASELVCQRTASGRASLAHGCSPPSD